MGVKLYTTASWWETVCHS